MSVTDTVTTGLIAVTDVLPPNPYVVAGLAAATGAVVISGGWLAASPAGMSASEPALTPTHLHRKSTNVRDASTQPLDVPLDTVPTDGNGNTPYDVVGPDAIRAAVDQFYNRLCGDPDLSDYFHHIDMAQLKKHQALFIGQLWGGPVFCPLERLAEAHQNLQISPERYWRVAGHLMVTLTHLDVPDWVCVFTMTRLYQARNLIIAQEQPSAAAPPPPDGGGEG